MAAGLCPRTTDTRRISDHVWSTHKKDIIFKMSVSIFQHLVDEEIILITDEAAVKYSNAHENEKKGILIDAVPECTHDDYLERFIRSLRKSVDEAGVAHKELAELLEREYERVKEDGVPEPVTIEGQGQCQRSFPVGGGGQTLPPNNKCMSRLRANWKWVVVYTSSLVWLLLGSLAAIILSQVPSIRPSRPIGVVGQTNSIIEIDLGIDQFWLSSATMAITPPPPAGGGCTGELYVLPNSNCTTLPITVQEFDRNNILFPPFYLLEGSTFNITLGENTPIVWFIGSRIEGCDDVDEWVCEDPPLPIELRNFRTECDNSQAGDTIFYTAEIPDYYIICAKGGLRGNPPNTLTLQQRGFNATLIREHYRPSASISYEPKTVDFKQTFDFSKDSHCLLLDVDIFHCNAPAQVSQYSLDVTPHRRQDVVGLAILISLAMFVVHLIIAGSLHSACHLCAKYSKTCNEQS